MKIDIRKVYDPKKMTTSQVLQEKLIQNSLNREVSMSKIKIKPCPFCGKPAKTSGENRVYCIDIINCCAQIDFGHWCGVENGIPAIQHVINQWNKRLNK